MSETSEAWAARVQEAANGNAEFAAGAEWLDLKLLLRIGEAAWWFKVYRGRVIDAMPYAVASNRLGYEVVVGGPRTAWQRIVDRSSSFGREHAMAALHVDGLRVEGDRAYRALVALGDQIVRSVGLPQE
nr:hypothetical protein [Variovorax boronicumulans]